MNKKIKIGIAWADTHSANLGVGALSFSAIYILNQILKEENREYKFVLFGGQGKYIDHFTINKERIIVYNTPGLYLFDWKALIKIILFPLKYRIWNIFNLDLVMDLSEGDSFTDIYGNFRFKKMLKSKIFFNRWAKCQIMLPQTVGPFKNKGNEKKAFQTMHYMQNIICRDKLSFSYSSKFLSPPKLQETIDLAFYLPYQLQKLNNDKINIGINISGLLWNGGYTQNNQFNLTADYQKLMEEILKYFIVNEKVQLHFIPHVIPSDNDIENDYIVSEHFHNKYEHKTILPDKFTNPISAKSYISGLDFFIGARMHACIAAFSAGVPVFPLAYSRKFNGLFVDTLGYAHMGDCVSENNEKIMKKMKSAFANLTELKDSIELINNSLVEERLSNLKSILRKTINEQL